jgi:glycosyltransferase involved in cell wall biosynthesis
MRSILFLGYPITDQGAPHQAMAAIYLAQRNAQVFFYAWGHEEAAEWINKIPNFEYSQKPKSGFVSAIKHALACARAYSRIKPSVLYVQGAQQAPFAFMLKPLLRNTLLIYHTQDFLEPGRHRFYALFERLIAKSADFVVVNEPYRGRFLQTLYSLRQAPFVIRTALPRSASYWFSKRNDDTSRLPISDTNSVLIFAGGPFADVRMSEQLLAALALLPPHYKVVFTGTLEGNHSYRSCRASIERHKVCENRVILLGQLPFRDLMNVATVCDVGILFYANDGIGNYCQSPGRLTEYLGCGLPIVSSDHPSLRNLIEQYSLGVSVDSENPGSIAAGISSAVQASHKEGRTIVAERLRTIGREVLAYETGADSVLPRLLNL